MKLTTFSYCPPGRWSVDPLPNLDSERTLVLVFAAPEFLGQPGPIDRLMEAYPAAHIIGCSTAGEIFGTSILDHSLTVAVVRFESTTLKTASAAVPPSDGSFKTGETIAKALLQPSLRAALVLSDGTNVNGSELIRGLNAVFPAHVVVTGGLAGDGERFERTWTLDRSGLRSDFVTAVGFYGDELRIGHGSKGGWDIFGPERRVTRARGNILFELDGKPALELYKDYLGDRATGLPATALLFPLALRADHTDQKSIVRTVLGVDESAQSMTFAGDIPEGYLAQLMKANFDRLIDGASEAALKTRESGQNRTPVLSIAISCVGRRLVLGERTEEELEATLDALPAASEQIGFYSYGEISPYTAGHCDLHNQTMTLTTISEA